MTKGSWVVQPRPQVPGFEVGSPCGRKWFVPVSAVQEDYAEFLMVNDGVTEEEAMAQATSDKDTAESWFYEQFDWNDVEHYGTLIQMSTEEDIRQGLNVLRRAKEPGDDATFSPS